MNAMQADLMLCERCHTPVYRTTYFGPILTPINKDVIQDSALVQVVPAERKMYYEYWAHHPVHAQPKITHCPGCGGTFKESE